MGTDPERNGSGVRLHISDLEPDLSIWEKSGFGVYGMALCRM